jgi:glutamate-1-semialdehyde 2,1-aminomutase
MDYDQNPEGAEDLDVDREWLDRAETIIPGGASTGSKRADALYGADAPVGPTHYTHARGCTIFTAGGGELLDCTMALGAVAIGYVDDMVTRSVIEAASTGNVGGLSPVLEVMVAERLSEVIPCAEQVRFLKTGAEAVAAAVRIARTYTNRDAVIGSGYFGWLDWSSSGKGIPARANADYTSVPFDDVAALAKAAATAGDKLAAIVIEPVVERLPSDGWLREARDICDRTGAVLIYDEIKTGFRVKPGGYQELCGIEPDLATFGKAMANGYPLSAVVGRAAVMDAARATWISSTLASETTALAAANAVLDWHEKADVCQSLADIGDEMMRFVRASIASSGAEGISVEGIPQMWFMRFDDALVQGRFLELALAHGVMFKRGPYNFPALAHDDDALRQIEYAASTALVELMEEREA